MAAADIPAVITELKAAFPRVSEETELKEDIPCVVVAREDVLGALSALKRAGFDFLLDLTAVDYPARAERFDVVYHLYAFEARQRLRVKTRTAAGQPVPTASALWKSANWFEREVFDLFGVRFDGHPNLVRIVMPDDWVGHPLRKDYPIGGENVQF